MITATLKNLSFVTELFLGNICLETFISAGLNTNSTAKCTLFSHSQIYTAVCFVIWSGIIVRVAHPELSAGLQVCFNLQVIL